MTGSTGKHLCKISVLRWGGLFSSEKFIEPAPRWRWDESWLCVGLPIRRLHIWLSWRHRFRQQVRRGA